MIRYFSFEKELRAVEGRIERGRIKEQVEFRPSCIMHQHENPEAPIDDSGKKRRVSGVVFRGQVYCFSHALAEAKKQNPDLKDPEFVKTLKPYREDLVQHLYIYDAAPAASSNNNHNP